MAYLKFWLFLASVIANVATNFSTPNESVVYVSTT